MEVYTRVNVIEINNNVEEGWKDMLNLYIFIIYSSVNGVFLIILIIIMIVCLSSKSKLYKVRSDKE